MSSGCCSRTFMKSRAPSPDSCWSFCVLFAGVLVTAIVNGCLHSFGVLLPQLMDYFGESRAKTALVGSLGQTVGYLLGPVGCYLFDRFGFRNTVVLCSFIAIAGLICSAVSPVLPLLYLTYGILASIGLSFIHNASVVVVMRHFAKWISIASGLQQSAFGIGVILITQISRPMIVRFGWRWTLGAWASLVALVIFLGLLYDGKDSTAAIEAQIDRPNPDGRHKLWSTLKNRLLLLYSCSFGLSYMAFYVPHMFLVKYSKEHLEIPHSRSISLYACFAVVSIFSRPLYCKLGTYKCFNRFVMYQISMALCGLIHFCIPLCKSYTHLAIVMLSLGFLDGGFWGLSALLVTDCAGIQNLNYAWGVFNCIAAVAGLGGSPLAGLIADLSNSYVPAFYASGTTLVLASTLIFFKKWTKSSITLGGILERQQLVTQCSDQAVVVIDRETVL